ncbi:MAG: THUMP domain-containing protein [Conexivisphaerales archaeon]|jgi:tRNA acetyltransferase TAN1
MEPQDGFNFIATTFKGLEREAASECISLLRKLGDVGPVASTTGVTGLVVGRTSLDPVEVVHGLKAMVDEEPWSVRLVLRFIPVEATTAATPEAVGEKVMSMSAKVAQGESFRVTVEKRHNETPSMKFVESAAGALRRKVDLEAPDWVVLVEVIRDVAGVSILKPSSVFSSVKAKRGE